MGMLFFEMRFRSFRQPLNDRPRRPKTASVTGRVVAYEPTSTSVINAPQNTRHHGSETQAEQKG
jgi:hypothetical protein